jgi:hypothetical protein
MVYWISVDVDNRSLIKRQTCEYETESKMLIESGGRVANVQSGTVADQ